MTNGYRAMRAAEGEADIRTIVDTARRRSGTNTVQTILKTVSVGRLTSEITRGSGQAPSRPPLGRRRKTGSGVFVAVPIGMRALAHAVVNDVEYAKAPPAGELVVHKVDRPACVRSCFDQDRRPRPTARRWGRRLRTVSPSCR